MSMMSSKISLSVSQDLLIWRKPNSKATTYAQTCFERIVNDILDRSEQGDPEKDHVVDAITSAQEAFPQLLSRAVVQCAEERAFRSAQPRTARDAGRN